jgi:hypothetical protein
VAPRRGEALRPLSAPLPVPPPALAHRQTSKTPEQSPPYDKGQKTSADLSVPFILVCPLLTNSTWLRFVTKIPRDVIGRAPFHLSRNKIPVNSHVGMMVPNSNTPHLSSPPRLLEERWCCCCLRPRRSWMAVTVFETPQAPRHRQRQPLPRFFRLSAHVHHGQRLHLDRHRHSLPNRSRRCRHHAQQNQLRNCATAACLHSKLVHQPGYKLDAIQPTTCRLRETEETQTWQLRPSRRHAFGIPWHLCYIFQGASRFFARRNRAQIPAQRGFSFIVWTRSSTGRAFGS